MATEVTLPQLGESVTEGTITAWLVDVGERVEADQPLFELSSDKIDTEVPAPTSGVLEEVRVGVDETVDVGTVVAVIAEGDDADAEAKTDKGDEAPDAEAKTDKGDEAPDAEAKTDESDEAPDAEAAPEDEARGDGGGPDGEAAEAEATPEAEEAEEPQTPAPRADGDGKGEPALTSPMVRRMASEHDIDLGTVEGSGKGGRITREDIKAAIEAQDAAPATRATSAAAKDAAPEGREWTENLSRIRQRIATKMMESLQGSAQLSTVQEADVTRMMTLREQVKDAFQAGEGVSLSPFALLARAAILALRNHPKLNAQADWEAGKVTYRTYVNLGIAVDTERGLIVPNVKGADDLSLSGLARAIKEVADKARGEKKLEITDIEGATFTMTNTGSVGVLIDTPILNYPEVAILGTGAIRKRPVVIEMEGTDVIAVRHMMYLSLTYDHRLIDGADAARFVTEVKEIIETHDWAAEVGYD